MKLKEYLNMETDYLISHLTLNESVGDVIDTIQYEGLYQRFYQDVTKGFHLLTYSNHCEKQGVEIYLVTNELEVENCNDISKEQIQLQIQYNANILQLIIRFRQGHKKVKVPINFNLEDRHISFELSKLLKQNTISVQFVSWRDGLLYKQWSSEIPITEKIKSAIIDFVELFLHEYNLEDKMPAINFDDLIIKNQANYLILSIQRQDIENMKVSKYAKMLNALYPNVLITHNLSESMDIEIKGYENDTRELWQIPEVRNFIRELNREFSQWFYFLDKNSEILYDITMCICGKSFTGENKYTINNLLLHDFINNQLKNLNEVCYYLNDIEKYEELKTNAFAYYEMFLS